ncbi:hypothetical protein [Gaopeijia maritima]|uniref:hypothetical protein n=1 Tax=Gaopeijia maritima TaxID=3119007 RepID=UPI00326EA13F
MASRWVRIAREVEALLSAPDRPTGLVVHRLSHRKLAKEKSLPATVINANGSETIETDDHDGGQTRTRTMHIEHRVEIPGDRPDTDEIPPEEALDPLITWTTRQLMAPDAFASGLVAEIREVRGSGDSVALEKTYAGRRQDFEIVYFTHESDPEVEELS